MLSIEEIRSKLKDRKVTVVSQATGIHKNTIYKIRRGQVTNPELETVKTLSDYLQMQGDFVPF